LKEILLNVYNSKWNEVPSTIVSKIQEYDEKVENNVNGEVIKILMITSSGAEGINLKNTRYVHIVEPYWHMVRLEQVIGRARRICSHQDLPEKMRTVQVFLYLSIIDPNYINDKKNDKHIRLKERDTSKLSKKMSEKIDDSSLLGRYIRHLNDESNVVTTDQMLLENALIKDRVNSQILMAVKETAIDCHLYASANTNEQIVCYGYGEVKTNEFGSNPALDKDFAEKDVEDTENTLVKYKIITDPTNDKKYAMNLRTKDLYDYEQYQRSKQTHETLNKIGRLVKQRNGEDKIILQ
jgi:hypothetical protein